ncbi:MAG: hypothetical protein JNL50_05795 [Phycisphaerae bacterium]|nr:hypothetical protein [Phycisphaerae bacterium]
MTDAATHSGGVVPDLPLPAAAIELLALGVVRLLDASNMPHAGSGPPGLELTPHGGLSVPSRVPAGERAAPEGESREDV